MLLSGRASRLAWVRCERDSVVVVWPVGSLAFRDRCEILVPFGDMCID